jgi:peptide methionine sulfoxide reductase msrA/msrB
MEMKMMTKMHYSLKLLLPVGMIAGLLSQILFADDAKLPSKEELKSRLTPLQYEVTQNGGTEPPFHNAYWDNKKPGIYVDIISGEPLFSSKDKFDAGTGWPSFTKPLEPANVVEVAKDGRVDVRSKKANSHLGDKFHDGPPPTGIRYCLDSAALHFIPAANLAKEGYGKYASQFISADTESKEGPKK